MYLENIGLKRDDAHQNLDGHVLILDFRSGTSMNPKPRTESYAAYDMHRLNSGDGHLHDFYVVIFLQSKIRKMIRVLVGYTQLIMVYNNLYRMGLLGFCLEADFEKLPFLVP